MSRSQQRKDRTVAALLTALVVALILVTLFFGGITWDRAALAESSTPEIMSEEEELFIEPELVELGEETAETVDKPAPAIKGEPDPAPEDRTEIIEPGENPKPAPPKPKVVTQKTPSPVKEKEPSQTDRDRQKATSSMANKFSVKNGAPEGKGEGTGAGGDGVGIKGNARGRTFISCPKPDVYLRHKTLVTVSVVIDAEGKVISASASGSAEARIRRRCEQAARGARWTPKKGAAETRGTITFTITPR